SEDRRRSWCFLPETTGTSICRLPKRCASSSSRPQECRENTMNTAELMSPGKAAVVRDRDDLEERRVAAGILRLNRAVLKERQTPWTRPRSRAVSGHVVRSKPRKTAYLLDNM